MSTPVGHSRLQPLQDTHSSSVSYISSEVKASGPSWPESARRSELARPRVRWRSSPVARKDGHIVPASNLRQCPLLLHISTAAANPWLAAPGTLHSLQSSAVSRRSAAYPGLKRNSVRSSCFEGRTIFPGFNRPFGSKRSLISSSARTSRSPMIGAIHSERTSPSPCSPEYAAPLYFFTSAQASSAIARIFFAPSSFMLRIGRTCSVPTQACAYQVPSVPFFSNTCVRESV